MEGLVISDVAKDLIINIINIIILFVIVRALAYKPVKKMLDARKERIESERAKAEMMNTEAQQKLDEYNALLEGSKERGAEIISTAERDAKKNAAEIIEQARKNAEAITENARKTAEEERNSKLASMKTDVAELAFDISKQILQREVTDEDNKHIADGFFEKYKA